MSSKLADLKRLDHLLKFKFECAAPSQDGLCPSDGKPHQGHPHKHARQSQLPPKGDWWVWLLCSGRGFGKTLAGANYVSKRALSIPNSRIAIVAPNFAKGRDATIEGESGIRGLYDGQGCLPWSYIANWNRSLGELYLKNGSVMKIFSAEDEKTADSIRGFQCTTAWVEELAACVAQDYAWSMLEFAVRLGDDPRIIVTTTPRPTKLMKKLMVDPDVIVTRGTTFENIDNLPARQVERLKRMYEGTSLGKQELYGIMLAESEGALWTIDLIEKAHSQSPIAIEDLTRIVVAVDPAGSGRKTSDETGIVVGGVDSQGVIHILEDASGRYSPEQWGSKVVELFERYQADTVASEVNFGSDMVKTVLRSTYKNLPVHGLTASRGKRVRAEPAVGLYERGLVKHNATFEALEEELTGWVPPGRFNEEGDEIPSSKESPGRLDALVWLCFELALKPLAKRGGAHYVP